MTHTHTQLCRRCGSSPHRPFWKQARKDWRDWTLYLRCQHCGSTRRCPPELAKTIELPLPDVAGQKPLFAEDDR